MFKSTQVQGKLKKKVGGGAWRGWLRLTQVGSRGARPNSSEAAAQYRSARAEQSEQFKRARSLEPAAHLAKKSGSRAFWVWEQSRGWKRVSDDVSFHMCVSCSVHFWLAEVSCS